MCFNLPPNVRKLHQASSVSSLIGGIMQFMFSAFMLLRTTLKSQTDRKQPVLLANPCNYWTNLFPVWSPVSSSDAAGRVQRQTPETKPPQPQPPPCAPGQTGARWAAEKCGWVLNHSRNNKECLFHCGCLYFSIKGRQTGSQRSAGRSSGHQWHWKENQHSRVFNG